MQWRQAPFDTCFPVASLSVSPRFQCTAFTQTSTPVLLLSHPSLARLGCFTRGAVCFTPLVCGTCAQRAPHATAFPSSECSCHSLHVPPHSAPPQSPSLVLKELSIVRSEGAVSSESSSQPPLSPVFSPPPSCLRFELLTILKQTPFDY